MVYTGRYTQCSVDASIELCTTDSQYTYRQSASIQYAYNCAESVLCTGIVHCIHICNHNKCILEYRYKLGIRIQAFTVQKDVNTARDLTEQ